MKILRQPPEPTSWEHRFDCKCGAGLEACMTDVRRRDIPDRQGHDTIYYVVCPFCQKEYQPVIPAMVKDVVDCRIDRTS